MNAVQLILIAGWTLGSKVQEVLAGQVHLGAGGKWPCWAGEEGQGACGNPGAGIPPMCGPEMEEGRLPDP